MEFALLLGAIGLILIGGVVILRAIERLTRRDTPPHDEERNNP
jgi:hypothetical protein